MNTGFVRPAIAIVLTACGIETCNYIHAIKNANIAIVLTACGIETGAAVGGMTIDMANCNSTYRLRY